jgi:sugar phosphate isomerase/epimerase
MVEFNTEYKTPMDRGYHEPPQSWEPTPRANIEEPIIPIAQLGQTVPEHDPSGRFKNILQTVQAAIRGGTGNLQIVFQTPIEQAIGGRPKAYGEEVRRAIKEVALANEVAITGMEMPTSLTNMSGWDPQRGIIDEEKRRRDLDEVKEMIRFAAEVGQGGGVDIVSWEYDRPLNRAGWIKKDSEEAKAFRRAIEEDKRKEEIRFVDKRSGQIVPVGIREGIFVFKDKKTFNDIPHTGEPQRWDYEDFERYAEHVRKTERTPDFTVHDAIKRHFLESQMNIAKAEASIYRNRFEAAKKQYERAKAAGDKEGMEEAELDMKGAQAGIMAQKRTEKEFMERIENWTDMNQFVLGKSAESYAEAGINAMQLQDQMGPKQIKHNLHVGPELGWPQFFGSHPKEFVETIKTARQKMVDWLTDPKECKRFGLDKPLPRSRAEEEAKTHVKGMFDTSHMGMWLQQFHPELPWDKRIKEFKKWYGKQIDWLAEENKKHDLLGGIQAVDSAGAAHGHLPPGQGILPVKDAIETLRAKGNFNGYVTSEGHEEEKFGEGRILLKTWQNFNAPFASGYNAGMPVRRWGEVQNAYFGRTYSPNFMFGAYAPSNEFKLWSEIPLE